MLPAPFVTHFETTFLNATAVMWNEIDDAKKAAWTDFAARGDLMSGAYFARLADAYEESLRRRGDALVESMKRAHSDFGYPLQPADQAEMIELAARTLAQQEDVLQHALSREIVQTGGQLPPIANEAIQRGWQLKAAGLQAAVQNRLRQYFWQLENVPSMKPRTHSESEKTPMNVTNIHGPVGAVLTGSHSNATVTQTFGSQQQAELSEAIQQLREVLRKLDMPRQDRDELLADVDAAREELSSAAPRVQKVLRLLGGIGTVIQSIGSAQPAWDVVSTVARRVGLPV